MNDENEKLLWYALRVTYNRELIVKKALEEKGIECFVPMTVHEVYFHEKIVRRREAAVHNLIFVKITQSDMKELKQSTTLPIRYIMDRETREPITVPERQMENFIAVCGTENEQLIYLSPEEIKTKVGDKVEVLEGIFKGCKGEIMRVKGDRRLVVSIAGLVVVATAFIHPSLVKKIEN